MSVFKFKQFLGTFSLLVTILKINCQELNWDDNVHFTQKF